jgi:hypothetical protein
MAESAALLAGRDGRPAHALARDPRGARPAPTPPDRLAARLAVYQGLQELHRLEPRLSVLFAGAADPDFVADVVALPRLEAAVEPTLREDAWRAIERLTVPGQVARREARSRRWDVVVASAAWIEAAGGFAFLEAHARALAATDPAGFSPDSSGTRAGFASWGSFPALLLSPALAQTIDARPGQRARGIAGRFNVAAGRRSRRIFFHGSIYSCARVRLPLFAATDVVRTCLWPLVVTQRRKRGLLLVERHR